MDEPVIPVGTDGIGPYGKFQYIDYEKTKPIHHVQVCCYLITAPQYHPLWTQYMLSVVSLAEHPGVSPAHIKFVDATHEIIVVAISPDEVQTKETMRGHIDRGDLRTLTPTNIAEQYQATDEEMKKLAWLCCNGVVNGHLNPETADAPTRIREEWLAACVKTLAHIRGEEHDTSIG